MKMLHNIIIKETAISYSNRAGHIRGNRGESTLSKIHSEMVKRAGKRNQMYVDCLSD